MCIRDRDNPYPKIRGSTNKKVISVNVNQPKWTFSGDYIPALSLLGVLAPQIFIRARDSPRLVSAHHNRGRGPPTNFKGEHLKFGLKFSAFTPITLGLVAITS